ncbi:MAG: 4-hydroxy-tetrahydrodipicolinate reductase, partial [Thermomicrobiales bacterium]
MIGLAVAGAGGRMGRQVLAAALADPDVTSQAGFVRPGSAVAGQDLGALAGGAPLGVAATAADAAHTALDGRPVNALIDFSRAAATVEFAALAAARGIAFLTGTTGLTPQQTATVKAAASRVPVLIASNTSVGLTALL